MLGFTYVVMFVYFVICVACVWFSLFVSFMCV